MRDISDYEIKYQTEPCEIYQVKYRRKKVLELLEKYEHKKILEIGCGMEPLFEYYSDFDKMVIVEPGEVFVENAQKKMQETELDITCIQGFLETSVEQVKMEQAEFDYIILSSLLHEVVDRKNC